MSQQTERIVKVALVSHIGATLFKLVTGLLIGSAALMSEALHSLMDSLNQLVLYRTQRLRGRPGEHVYAYGHATSRYLLSLWSSVGLFSIGCGLAIAWSVYAWVLATGNEPLLRDNAAANWTLLAVLGGLLIQGYSFFLAARDLFNRMQDEGQRNPFRYLPRCGDVTLAVIVVQSGAGLIGLLLAGLGAVLVSVSGQPLWDALAALLIGLLMGWVAFYLGYLYMRFLTDVRDREAELALRDLVGNHRAVDRCERIRSLILDDHRTVLFADIVLQQETMINGLPTRISSAKKKMLAQLPAEQSRDTRAQAFVTARATVEASLSRAEMLVLELEQRIREQVPQVAEVSIRVLGISPFKIPDPPVRKPPPSQDADII